MSTPSPILRSVCEQRDRAWEMIDTLISAFWSAHHNGAFEAEDQRYLTDKDGKAILGGTGEHKPYRCSAGRSLIDVFHGCDIFDSDRCRGFDCPMGFHHRYLYEKVRDAAAVLKEPRAERVPFDLSRIPQFDKDCAYTITPQWYARLFLAFFSDYRFGGLRRGILQALPLCTLAVRRLAPRRLRHIPVRPRGSIRGSRRPRPAHRQIRRPRHRGVGS